MAKGEVVFPPPYSRRPPHKTLAWLDGDTITTEHGESERVNGWHNIRNRIAADNLLTFSQHLVSAPYWTDALADGASPAISRKAGITALRVKSPTDGRQFRWLVDSTVWGHRTSRGLSSLRHLFTLCGEGDHPTPSALGLSTMAAWWDQREPKLYPPSKTIDRIIRENLVGGRVDTIKPKELFQNCYEVDINSAYAWAAQRVPTGSCYAVSPKRPSTLQGAFYRCQIKNVRRRTILGCGPLPVRESLRVTYPTEGTWTGWYWSEEVQAALEAGYNVTIECGFEWPEWSMGLMPWAEQMHALRSGISNPTVRGMVKLSTVAGIGRFLGHSTAQQLTTEETDVPYLDAQSGFMDPAGGISPYYLKEKARTAPELLPHVGSYIMAQVRLATYRQAIQEGDALIATNYDAVYTLRRPDFTPSTELGGWKWTTLTNASVQNPRWIESDQKVRRPGFAA